MSQKNETAVLVLALLITAALLGAGFWWLTRKSGFDLNSLPKPNPTSPANPSGTQSTPPAQSNTSSPSTAQSDQPTQSTGQGFAQIQVPRGLFNYGGSTSWAPIRPPLEKTIQASHPEFKLRYTNPNSGAPGSTTGIKMLINDQLDFALSSRPLRDQEYQQAQQRGFSLRQIGVAIDGLAVAVNPNLNISGLTVAQLRSIYTGQIKNWNQLGGPNVPITPISRPITSGGTVELFVEDVLGGQPLAANVQLIPTTTEALRRVASTPGGIYYASAPEVVPQCTVKPIPLGRQAGQFVPPYEEPLVSASQCKSGQTNQLNIPAFQNGQYPLTRNLFVVVKQNSQVGEQAGNAYANLLLTAEGQELISQAGFVRIR